jgi:hypothetical protein
MANNRIFFCNDRFGVGISIGKFCPGGWSLNDRASDMINAAFERDHDLSMFGLTVWCIEFETVADSHGEVS